MNELNQMFELQNNIQEKLGTWDKTNKSDSMKQQFINQMLLACQEEVIEIMRETAYKNSDLMEFGWKKNQFMNVKLYKEEIIDLWHFVMNLWLVVGGTPEEFFQEYKKKNNINLKRQEEGY